MSDKESFLSRWSRRKQSDVQSDKTASPSTPPATKEQVLDETTIGDISPDNLNDASTADTTPVESEPPLLTDADMPPIETLNESSDYRGFMSPDVSDALRKAALRKLFQGDDFNVRDGLDDYDEDYTRFIPRGNLITSDMKHQMEVEAKRQLEQSMSERDPAMSIATPKQAALASLNSHTPPPTGQVEYHSQGRVLIIGDEQALRLATNLPDPLQAQVILTQASDWATDQSMVIVQGQRSLTLQGWLGDFRLQLSDEQQPEKPQNIAADLVIDLGDTPLIAAEVAPPGYFSGQKMDTAQIIEAITPLEGQFAKPRFFDYNSDICAHSSSGLAGCTRCIDACPTDAIISIGDKIQVEPHLCQGGGTCATACPSGAIRYNYPSAGFQVNQIRRLLKQYRDAGGEQAILLLHANDTDIYPDALADNILPFALEELASAGAELWAAALSFGASQVLLLDDPQTPASSRRQLRHQLSILQTQFSGMGYPDQAVRLIPALDGAKEALHTLTNSSQAMPYFPPATQAGMENKRQQWMIAMDHFYKHAPEPQDSIPLPKESPFGILKVDKQACTLCMACATVCPAQALSGGTDSPVLKLHPANCLQCGLCETGCPEQAISLIPLFISDREQRNRPLVLNEEQPFHCVECGKPFASHSMIHNMLNKLQGHAMFQSERAIRRLKMCEDCRVVDVVQDDMAMGQPGLSDPRGGSPRH